MHLPDALRLGDVGQGWGISIASLHSEREGTGEAFARPIDGLLDLWKAREPTAGRRTRSRCATS